VGKVRFFFFLFFIFCLFAEKMWENGGFGFKIEGSKVYSNALMSLG
jgi:hypothetical protein